MATRITLKSAVAQVHSCAATSSKRRALRAARRERRELPETEHVQGLLFRLLKGDRDRAPLKGMYRYRYRV